MVKDRPMKRILFLLFIAAPVFAHEPTNQPEPTTTAEISVPTEISAPIVNTHSGRTNKSGCHNDNKNGGYHCH